MNKVNNEVWKTYPEFDWIQVSTMGRVRTLDRVVTRGNGKLFIKGKILKQRRDNNGYMDVAFNVNGKVVNRYVHRLVAQTFIPNPDNLPQVNHKDCNRTNNHLNNLEWCTNQYNIDYREKYGTPVKEAQGYPVYTINIETQEVSKFHSQSEASRALGVFHSNINKVVKGQRKQAGGYWFTNADDNTVEATRCKFGSEVADKVEELMNDNEMQPA